MIYYSRSIEETGRELRKKGRDEIRCLVLSFKTKEINDDQIPTIYPFETCTRMAIGGYLPLTNKSTKMMLENCKATEWLRVNHPINRTFQFNAAACPAKLLELNSTCGWLTVQNLLDSNAKAISVKMCQFSVEDLEQFDEGWMNSSENKRLIHVKLNLMDKPKRKLNLKKFQPKKWSEARRSASFIDCFTDTPTGFTSGKDIERADGLFASFKLSRDKFKFVVWHDRFPEHHKADPSTEEEE